MEPANTRQVGGAHYRDTAAEYQHWDLVADTDMGYFEGQITKYVARWRKKNGRQDLEKALHYCDKLMELVYADKLPTVKAPADRQKAWSALTRFLSLHPLTNCEQTIFELAICRRFLGELHQLRRSILALLEEAGAPQK
jgi:Protein of unknwon function (DUF3310)